ncbi:hypothetical protein DKG77_00905 [Flagellimonas aquimarina]|uniref:Uncharacterized protein n=1 Tax=Flagellimonas aquimarina TaxID=2201895 RepID=A0A316L231_9FLAO|nr:hypothetical protein [Allomuricauda koreensis]PWL39428.1 hypothetical protein DKG77_00905 [Allomuricauda koreensis]
MEQKHGVLLKWFWLGVPIVSAVLMFFYLCRDADSHVVNLVLKKKNKTYLFSKLGTTSVKYGIVKNESPNVFGFVHLFEEKNRFYVNPAHIKEIIDLLCGNYVLHDYEQQNYDGYVKSGKQSCLKKSFKNGSVKKIGEQMHINMVQLTNRELGNLYDINWEHNLKENESRALENCEKKSFMITTQILPGETVTASKDFIMVNLDDVVKFYGNEVGLRLDEKKQLLFIVE